MPMLSHLHQLFNAEQCQAYIRAGGKTGLCNVLTARVTTLDAGARTNIDPDANATGAIAASAPSTISLILCCTRASGRWRTGSSLPFCPVLPVRLGALPRKWGRISGRAIAGVGGYAMRPCPMRCTANWQARSKRMTSTTPQARRDKPSRAGRSRWGADRVVVVRSASRAGAMMTQTGRRSSCGSAARVPL